MGGINKNWLEVGEARSETTAFCEQGSRVWAGVSGRDIPWLASSCISLNVKHEDERGVGRERGVIGRVRSVLKGQNSVGGTMIRRAGFLGR